MGDGAQERGLAGEARGADGGVAVAGARRRAGDAADSGCCVPARAAGRTGMEGDDRGAETAAPAGDLSLSWRGSARAAGGSGGGGGGGGGAENEPGMSAKGERRFMLSHPFRKRRGMDGHPAPVEHPWNV